MIGKIKDKIYSNKIIGPILIKIYRLLKSILNIPGEYHLYRNTKYRMNKICGKQGKIFYIGIPVHKNLGDLAQGVCIRKWIKKHYPDRNVVEIETNALVNTHFSLLKKLKKIYHNGDIIIFQSGYTTTDLGGFADDMHCAVMKILPNAKMLMMPQTIFFKSEDRKKRTSDIYDHTENLLFLARDHKSFKMAKEMFPNILILKYPDIVTTMIGGKAYNSERKGILFCCRDDSEKYYSKEEINQLMNKCSAFANIEQTDTTKKSNRKELVTHSENYILNEIERYSHFQLLITDRYHGTIFSLVAGTPVIIIKTTDHKVTTGAEWFKGVYDDYVYLADSLDEAEVLARELLNKKLSNKLEPYFEREYYDKLPELL